MCEHTWDPNKTWGVYYWEELIPPLIVYRSGFFLTAKLYVKLYFLNILLFLTSSPTFLKTFLSHTLPGS